MAKVRTGFNAKEFAAKRGKPIGLSAGISNSASIMAETTDNTAGMGVYRDVSVDNIDLDPDQPRQETKPTTEEVEALKQLYPQFKQFLKNSDDGFDPEGLRSLYPERANVLIRFLYFANDIENHGLTQPIIIYRTGLRYVIADGERRFRAHVLIGKSKILAIERPQRNLNEAAIEALNYYLKQVGANLQREDFSVREKLAITKRTIAKFQEAYDKVPSVRELADLLGIGRGSAQRYQAILNGEAGLDSLKDEEITLTGALDKLKAKDGSLSAAGARTKQPKSGRKAKVDLGKIEDPRLVRTIMSRVDPDSTVAKDIDWDDAKAVQKLWQQFVVKLTKELK